MLLVFDAAGVWVAAQLVKGMSLEGSAGQQLLALLVVVAVNVVGVYLSPVLVGVLGGCLGVPLMFAFAVASSPLLLWAGVAVCRWLDLPLDIAGFWPLILAAVVVHVVVACAQQVWAARTKSGRRQGALAAIVRTATSFGVLVLIAAVFDGARIETGAGSQQLLTLSVLAVVFIIPDITVNRWGEDIILMSWVSSLLVLAVYAVVANALMLWLISWISTGLTLTLSVSGFVTFLLASLLGTAVMWLVNAPFLLYGGRHATAVRTSRFGFLWVNAQNEQEIAEFDPSPLYIDDFDFPD